MAHARLAAPLDDAAQLGAGGGGNGDQDLADLVRRDERGEVVDPSEHGNPTHAEPELGRVVVDEAHHADLEPPATLDLVREPDPGLAGAHDQGEGLDPADGPPPAPLPREPDGEASAPHERRAEDEVEEEDDPWEPVQPVGVEEDHGREEEHRGQQIPAHHVLRVSDAHVAPPPREQTERPEPDQLADEQEGEGGEQDRGVSRRNREIESQREGRDVGRGRDGHVAEHDDERPVTKKNGEDGDWVR